MTRLPQTRALLALLAASACTCDNTLPLRKGLPPGYKQDILPQVSVQKLDLLWIVDDSGSMENKQANVAANFDAFFQFIQAAKVDYQIAIGTTDIFNDAGQLRADVITPGTSDPAGAFRDAIKVGVAGKALEEGLAGAEDILEADRAGTLKVAGKPDVIHFARDDAFLFIVAVSDEEDHSFGEPRYFWRSFEQAKGIGNNGKVSFSAIAGGNFDPDQGKVVAGDCTDNGGATAAARYFEVADLTGGLVGSICDASFEATLREFGRLAVGLRRKFPLSSKPDLTACAGQPDKLPACLQVTVRYRCDAPAATLGACTDKQDDCKNLSGEAYGIACTPPFGGADGWAYEAGLNAIRFDGTSIPGLGSQVEVVYRELKAQ